MSSVLTNTNAMAALATLRNISSNMEDTQARISSGLRVGSASDNAAYWSIATTMRSDNMALSSVSDALGLGAAKVDTAYAGMESAIEVVKESRPSSLPRPRTASTRPRSRKKSISSRTS
jgi:flagellin